MRDNGLSNTDFNKSLFAMIFAAMGMGQASMTGGDTGQAAMAAIRIYNFLDQKGKIKDRAITRNVDQFNGRVEFVNVTFRYPSRQERVFRKMNFVIEPGTNVAFVGPSGSGKSTIIQLLLRFYDIDSGQILLGGNADDPKSKIDMKEISLKNLRK